MRTRLRASGVRPINNIVDITNYVMLEYGQPMHAFDYACLARQARSSSARAEEGEIFRTLDGNDHALTPEHARHCRRDEGPVALAGVMGGANSEITDDNRRPSCSRAPISSASSVRMTANEPRHAHGRLRPV